MDRHLHEDLFHQMKMNREMFEGKDYPTQWALNPSMYQNMSNDQVDWAALAQQWIQMKESVVPPAPPPPSLSNNDSLNDDRGEVPMDMDTKDDDIPPAPPAPNISGTENWNQWSQWGQWNASAPGGACWEWSGVPPPGVTMGPDGKPMGLPNITIPIVPPAPNISGRSGYSVPPPGPIAPPYNYNSIGGTQPGFNQISGYWTGEQGNSITTGHPPPFIKGLRQHHPRMPQIRNDINRIKEKTPEDDTSMIIDAAKRRQLPAWIREGLEKMERQKHKAVERERQEILRYQEMEARKIVEEEARAVLDPSKSKFDSDSEKELEPIQENRGSKDDWNNSDASPEIVVRARKSRFRDAVSPESHLVNNDSPPPSTSVSTAPVKRSREEILQDVMLKVRRSLTEILLEVTNEEISNVSREVWNRFRAKAPAGDTPVASFNNKAPLAQITRKLGLGIYGDSNSESEEEQINQVTDGNDSDAELKETLRRRQAAFKKTEEEIEARLAEEEENENWGNNDENTSKYENHTSNVTSKDSVDEKEINNEKEGSESQSSGDKTPRNQIQSSDNQKINANSPNKSYDSASSSIDSPSFSSDSDYSDSSRSRMKKRQKHKSKIQNKSRGRKSRSLSQSRSKRSGHKRYRSRSLSRKLSKKTSRDRKKRSRSQSTSRSVSRRRSRSYSRRRSKDRKRSRTRSRSKNRNRSSRSYSRERRRSRSYGHRSSSKRRNSRSKSKERRRSRSRSRGYRDGKKSSHRYRD